MDEETGSSEFAHLNLNELLDALLEAARSGDTDRQVRIRNEHDRRVEEIRRGAQEQLRSAELPSAVIVGGAGTHRDSLSSVGASSQWSNQADAGVPEECSPTAGAVTEDAMRDHNAALQGVTNDDTKLESGASIDESAHYSTKAETGAREL